MPALKNQKHEQFCQLTIRGAKHGWSQAEIYQRAGFAASGHSAEVAASRLMKKPEIRARLSALVEPGVKKAQITVESLLAELETNIIGAATVNQHAAINGSITLMAKLRGLLVDRAEIGGPGEFANLDTREKVIDALIAVCPTPQETLALLDRIHDEVEARAAEMATTVEPTTLVPRGPSNEAERALELFRPKWKGRR
jgi:hypothetical protein